MKYTHLSAEERVQIQKDNLRSYYLKNKGKIKERSRMRYNAKKEDLR